MNEMITNEMKQIRDMIIETFSRRECLRKEMQLWYDNHPDRRFEKMQDLITTDATLSQLDSQYKNLWDFYNMKSS